METASSHIVALMRSDSTKPVMDVRRFASEREAVAFAQDKENLHEAIRMARRQAGTLAWMDATRELHRQGGRYFFVVSRVVDLREGASVAPHELTEWGGVPDTPGERAAAIAKWLRDAENWPWATEEETR